MVVRLVASHSHLRPAIGFELDEAGAAVPDLMEALKDSETRDAAVVALGEVGKVSTDDLGKPAR